MSPRKSGTSLKFAACVRHACVSASTAQMICHPAIRTPLQNPPAPLNNDMALSNYLKLHLLMDYCSEIHSVMILSITNSADIRASLIFATKFSAICPKATVLDH